MWTHKKFEIGYNGNRVRKRLSDFIGSDPQIINRGIKLTMLSTSRLSSTTDMKMIELFGWFFKIPLNEHATWRYYRVRFLQIHHPIRVLTVSLNLARISITAAGKHCFGESEVLGWWQPLLAFRISGWRLLKEEWAGGVGAWVRPVQRISTDGRPTLSGFPQLEDHHRPPNWLHYVFFSCAS